MAWPNRQRVKRKIDHTITMVGTVFHCSACGPIRPIFEGIKAQCPTSKIKGVSASKYGNSMVRIELPYGKGWRKFDSKLEAERAVNLCHFENENYIEDLVFQKRIKLIVDGQYVSTYIADFSYKIVGYDEEILEDTKGVLTDVFKLKAALYKATTKKEIVIIKRKDVGSRPTKKQ